MSENLPVFGGEAVIHPVSRSAREGFSRAVTALSLYAFAGGALSFLGWLLDHRRLTDWQDGGISIQPNATLATMLAGSALLALCRRRPSLCALFGLIVTGIAGATAFEYLSGIELGSFDHLLMFDRTWGRGGVLAPGRMGPPGTASWCLIGTALMLASRPAGSRARRWAQFVAAVPAAIATLSIVGYLYRAGALYMIPTLTVIAFQTATFILAISLGILFAIPEHGLTRVLVQRSPAGILARRLAPLMVVLSVFIGLVRAAGERAGLYDSSFGSAARTVVEIVLFLFLLWRTGLAIERQLAKRQEAEVERERLLDLERRARADAEREASIKDEFLSTLSHELRTPLNSILGWAHLMRKELHDPEKAAHALDVIERNGRAQAQLIGDMLDMSRIESGKMRLEVQPVDLPMIIEAAIETVGPAADAKGVRIETAIETVGDVITGDPGRLQQVVWNLLSNSVKFTPRNGTVRVTVAKARSRVEIRVEDTGEGIAPEFLPHVFDRFRQADGTPSRTHGGLGLGLALVRQLIELHGGRVSASSEGRGKGATFVVALPLSVRSTKDAMRRTPPAIAQSASAEAWHGVDLRGARALLVDDEPDALEMLRRMLEDSGATAVTVGGVDEALAALERTHFDVIVSDIAMPGRDGYEFIRECRARGIATPAIALTAFARAEDRAGATLAGFQSHVAKPVDEREFLLRVVSLARVGLSEAATPNGSAP